MSPRRSGLELFISLSPVRFAVSAAAVTAAGRQTSVAPDRAQRKRRAQSDAETLRSVWLRAHGAAGESAAAGGA
jgi:hypothetical protein